MKRKIVCVISAATGDLVIVGEDELQHAARHFVLPRSILVELLTVILKDPSEVFLDTSKPSKLYKIYYKLEDNRYLLVIVKILKEGAFFASMYSTGKKVKARHSKMKRIKI